MLICACLPCVAVNFSFASLFHHSQGHHKDIAGLDVARPCALEGSSDAGNLSCTRCSRIACVSSCAFRVVLVV
jgi:hypothetical protein